MSLCTSAATGWSGSLVPTPELFARLLAPRPEPWRLTGIDEAGDPFLIALGSQDKGEPFDALELDGATLVALEAAGDNGAIKCGRWKNFWLTLNCRA